MNRTSRCSAKSLPESGKDLALSDVDERNGRETRQQPDLDAERNVILGEAARFRGRFARSATAWADPFGIAVGIALTAQALLAARYSSVVPACNAQRTHW
jgi:hypothetical protein